MLSSSQLRDCLLIRRVADKMKTTNAFHRRDASARNHTAHTLYRIAPRLIAIENAHGRPTLIATDRLRIVSP